MSLKIILVGKKSLAGENAINCSDYSYVPMIKEAEMLLAIKQFVKAIVAPDAPICYATKVQNPIR